MPARIDAELDLHVHTAASARDQLEFVWSRRIWQGMRRVRIVHGTGAVLYKVVRRWAEEKAIPFTLEAFNPGVTILQPSLRRDHAMPPSNQPFARHVDNLRALLPPVTENGRRAEESPATVSPTPEATARPSRQQEKDLFAEAMEQLAMEDPRATHRRKQGL